MSEVHLSGHLVCRDVDDAEIVGRHLPRHVASTRAEPGCVSFEVHRTDDPLVWYVDERFRDVAAFDAHNARVATSTWGRVTSGIERRYTVRGIESTGR